jgi:cystathionine beta-lyase/cystathionine gamma-synthase
MKGNLEIGDIQEARQEQLEWCSMKYEETQAGLAISSGVAEI